jgi:proteasome alpha subunit
VSMSFYVPPEQLMRDRADYARKNIARGRPLVGSMYADGILIVAENASRTLHKIGEIYDRIAFAGVGKYNEFDQLRVAGVRHADTKGYAYSREDVDARGLANVYAQYLNQVFIHEMKPMEVEILVAQVGMTPDQDSLYHVTFDGTMVDEDSFSVLGGEAETIAERMTEAYEPGLALGDALRRSVTALTGPEETAEANSLEVAILSRTNGRRAFRRIDAEELAGLLTA